MVLYLHSILLYKKFVFQFQEDKCVSYHIASDMLNLWGNKHLWDTQPLNTKNHYYSNIHQNK